METIKSIAGLIIALTIVAVSFIEPEIDFGPWWSKSEPITNGEKLWVVCVLTLILWRNK